MQTDDEVEPYAQAFRDQTRQSRMTPEILDDACQWLFAHGQRHAARLDEDPTTDVPAPERDRSAPPRIHRLGFPSSKIRHYRHECESIDGSGEEGRASCRKNGPTTNMGFQ